MVIFHILWKFDNSKYFLSNFSEGVPAIVVGVDIEKAWLPYFCGNYSRVETICGNMVSGHNYFQFSIEWKTWQFCENIGKYKLVFKFIKFLVTLLSNSTLLCNLPIKNVCALVEGGKKICMNLLGSSLSGANSIDLKRKFPEVIALELWSMYI